MAKEKKIKSKTVSTYKKWNAAKWGLFAGQFAAPVVPAAVMTAVNWEEWFAKSGHSLPLGFASLLVTVILAVVGLWKKNEIVEKSVSIVFYLSLLFFMIGVTCCFLASLFSQVGYMFMATGGGLLASGICDQVNKSIVNERVNEYRKLIDDNNLDYKAKHRQERIDRARREAEEEARKRAIE